MLSENGGLSFDAVLATNVPNDGSHNVVAPGLTTSTARIMVKSVGNVFFAVNNQEFSIQDSEFILDFAETVKEVCSPENAVFDFTFKTFLGFNENTTFSATGLPTGASVTFSPASASSNNTSVQMTINGIAESEIGSYEITVTGSSNTVTKSTLVNLDVYASTIAAPILLAPAEGSTNIKKPYTLSWVNDNNVQNYVVELASDTGFTEILESAVISETIFDPSSLMPNTNYFWRVKGQNLCGESAYSEIRSFTTENEVCSRYVSTSTPLSIPDNNPTGVLATIEITNQMIVTDVNVGVTVSHSWVGDLRLILTGPAGNSVVLVSNSERSGQGYTNTIFDDDAEVPINSGLPPYTGTFAPEGSLSIFNEKGSVGTWTLNISDNEAQDVGTLETFFLDICGVPFAADDSDGDGVVNDDDLCPNTPIGMVVDETGCVILDGDHFTVNAVGETCPDFNNGVIEISAKTGANYTADFNGQLYNFTTSYTIEGISPGIYDLCITLEGDTFEQCYSLTIQSNDGISGKSTLSNKNLEVEILQGTPPFKVFKNDLFVFETSMNVFDIAVADGDVISVTTSKDCEGVYVDKVNLKDEVRLYPNPSSSNFNISIPTNDQEVLVEIYSLSGQLIRAVQMEVRSNQVSIDSAFLAQGVYIVRVGLKKPVNLKLIKK